MKSSWIWVALLSMSISIAHAQDKSTTYLFIGSYTDGIPGRGIYMYSFNAKSGAVKEAVGQSAV